MGQRLGGDEGEGMCQKCARLLCSAYLLNTDSMLSNAGTGAGDGGVS